MTLAQTFIATATSFAERLNEKARATWLSLVALLATLSGVTSLNVATTGGTGTPTVGQLQAATIRLTGLLTANRTVTLPTLALLGQSRTFTNATTGNFWLKVVGAAGGSFYLAPGQSKTVQIGTTGIVTGEDLDTFEVLKAIDLAGPVSTINTVAAVIPPGFVLELATLTGKVTKVGGTSTMSMGIGSATDVLLASTTPATANGIVGLVDAELGALKTDTFRFPVIAGGTLTVANVITGSAVTAGQVNAYARAVRVLDV